MPLKNVLSQKGFRADDKITNVVRLRGKLRLIHDMLFVHSLEKLY